MFKKADKSELRLWLIGVLFLMLTSIVVTISLVGGLITNGFAVKRLIWAIIFALLAVLFVSFFVKIIKAFTSYDERQNKQKENEAKNKAKQEKDNKEKLEREMEEMEALKLEEAQKREEMRIKLEEMKKEKEAQEAAIWQAENEKGNVKEDYRSKKVKKDKHNKK
ncbi:MAG: hypothetical protein IJS58_05645 [Bacilli bacterium]|nr:hypothetical protein [Bacilli bacterium]